MAEYTLATQASNQMYLSIWLVDGEIPDGGRFEITMTGSKLLATVERDGKRIAEVGDLAPLLSIWVVDLVRQLRVDDDSVDAPSDEDASHGSPTPTEAPQGAEGAVPSGP